MMTMIYDHNDWWSGWLMIMMIAIILSVRNHEWRRKIMDFSCSVHDDHDDWWSSWLMFMIFFWILSNCEEMFCVREAQRIPQKYSMFSWSIHDEVISQVHICLESIKHSQSNLTSRPSMHTSETITIYKINTLKSQIHSC